MVLMYGNKTLFALKYSKYYRGFQEENGSAMKDLLEKCSDIHVRCSDGDLVAANKFTLLSTCTVLRDMCSEFEDLSVIPMDTLPKRLVEVAIEVIHGVRKIQDLSLEETELCLEGFDIFGCVILRKKLLSRLWALISKSTSNDEVFRHGERLLFSELHARDYLNKVKSLCPKWKDFKELFQRVQLCESVALLCMWRLCKFFSAHLVFEAILDAFPPHVLTLDTCFKIWGSYRTGVYHHPDEIVMSTNKVLSKFPECERVHHLQTISDAFGSYETSPGSKLISTTLTFANEPFTSVLIKVYEPFQGTRSLRIGKFLTLALNTTTGRLSGTLDVNKLHAFEHYPTTILLRLTTFVSASNYRYDIIGHSYTTQEVWREYPDVEDTVELEDYLPYTTTDEEALINALRSADTLRYIRLDFFYGPSDIRKTPIF